jgi:hypothetical protein
MNSYREIRFFLRAVAVLLGVALLIGARQVCLLLEMKALNTNILLWIVFFGFLLGVLVADKAIPVLIGSESSTKDKRIAIVTIVMTLLVVTFLVYVAFWWLTA